MLRKVSCYRLGYSFLLVNNNRYEINCKKRFLNNGYNDNEGRHNALGIKMLSKSLHRQLFGKEVQPELKEKLENTVKSLLTHGLLKGACQKSEKNIEFVLPRLRGRTLEEHFHNIGYEFCYPYKKLADEFIENDADIYPNVFLMKPGWTRYSRDKDIKPDKVEYPCDDVLVFDVETSVTARNIPVMATAFSSKYWYSWCSPYLISCKTPHGKDLTLPGELPLDAFIPLGRRLKRPQIVIGHNVSFDRSYIKEEYYPTPGQRYFLDTLSLHQCVGGFAGSQRKRAKTTKFFLKNIEDIYYEQINLQKMSNRYPENNIDWVECGSFNDLNSLAMFYLNQPTEKSTRDIFVDGSLTMIKDNFQKMMGYCAHDVLVTFGIFKQLWPLFLDHSPSPVSLSGILMLSKCYLPINKNWKCYINSSETVFDNYAQEMTHILKSCAADTLREGLNSSSVLTNERNLWIRNLDWTTELPHIKQYYVENERQYKDCSISSKKNKKISEIDYNKEDLIKKDLNVFNLPDLIDSKAAKKYDYWGVPKWYAKLIGIFNSIEKTGILPQKIDTKDRLVPTLLKMSWNGWPIVYNRLLGWGYLLNSEALSNNQINILGEFIDNSNHDNIPAKHNPNYHVFDFETYFSKNRRSFKNRGIINYYVDFEEVGGRYLLENIFEIDIGAIKNNDLQDSIQPLISNDFLNTIAFKLSQYEGFVFVPIPHPSRIRKPCGNPLARDYALHVLSGKMLPQCGEKGIRFFQLFLASSYWQNNRDRIRNQIIGRLDKNLPNEYSSIPQQDTIGAIIPRLIPCGTITRRAVENTWLTASNPQQGMVGSEMKSAIQAPKGFVFVGADVDSEELWLASLLGDAAVGGFHGSTPFSYMNIAGKTSERTDLHSVTARAIGISRDSAKVINYSRLYGAGHNLAISQMLMSDSNMSVQDAIIKTCYLFNFTKGLRVLKLNNRGIAIMKIFFKKNPQKFVLTPLIGKKTFCKILKKLHISPLKFNRYGTLLWKGGSESEIFNLIEQFIYVNFPSTPFLKAQMSNGMATFFTKQKFKSSKFNWTIQSSAVDFLHSLLVSIFWMFSIAGVRARLVMCVHDEIRFMVHEENAVLAAFILHIGNLMTRSFFSQKLGINDLPQKNAFFESVEVDTIIRKKPKDACVTPSNPGGEVLETCSKFGKSYTIEDCLKILGNDIFLCDSLKSRHIDCNKNV